MIGKFSFDQADWNDVSDEAKDLIKKMICVDVDQRISVQNALDHIWFTKTK